MLKVGITGGIGSGKSTVARIFSELGIPVYSSDQRAKELITEDADLKNAILNLMGKEAYLSDGTYNRSFVSQRVFQNPEELKLLNALIHPAVGLDFAKWMETKSGPYLLKEAAIMKKSPGLDVILWVHSPEELRIQRVMRRDGRTYAQVKRIIESQQSEEEFRSISDFQILNDESTPLLSQVLALDEKLRHYP
jgi:dephospho-CoA kinase